MTENRTPANGPDLLSALRHAFAFDERRRFILLFLVINLLIFILIWLSWQNQVLVRRVSVLETRIVILPETHAAEAIGTCEANCTDKMTTMTARQREIIAQVTATVGALIPRLPTSVPTGVPTWTAAPSPTFTSVPSPPPPTPSSTPTGTPTLPTPVDTPTVKPTKTPSPTPTHTSTPTPTATPTWTPGPTTPPAPVVLGITPAATVRSVGGATFPVTITGRHFAQNVEADLGAGIQVAGAVSSAAGTTITGDLSPEMPVGVYGLIVINRDGSDQFDTLSPAFTIYSRPVTILESPYIVTFGRHAGPPYDTPRHQVQEIYFEVPDGVGGDLYVHIFDADTGGEFVDDHGGDGVYGTPMTYTLYGSTVITAATIGENVNLNERWGYNPEAPEPPFRLGRFSPSDGELVGDRRIFRLTVEGGGGNDANWYRVALSTLPDANTVPYEAWMFAFYWTGLVHPVHQRDLRLHTHVTDTTTMTLGSMGCASDGGELLVRTPFRTLTRTCSAGTGAFTSNRFDVADGERGMTWTLDLSNYLPSVVAQSILFWAEDEMGSPLSIFVRPTVRMPP